MQQHIHTIVKHFFQKDSLQEVTEQALQQFTEDHPYSSVGHWLLARKLRQSSAEQYEAQAARTATWYNNPLWLKWTLEDREKTPETLFIPPAAKEAISVPQETAPVATPEPEAVQAPQPVEEQEPVVEVVEAVATPVVTEDADTETEIMIPGVSEPISLVEEPVAIPAAAEEAEEVEETVEVETVEVAEEPVQQPAEPETPVTPVQESVAQETPTPADEKPAPLVSRFTDEYKPVIVNAEEPLFEPYHTIDYFASLGIKLRQEDMRDKLGVQLKSFTEWLRSMKRVTPTTMEVNLSSFDETLQQSIQESAGHSVQGKDVITEAMADVWLKQGNKQKAIAIYEKLSLLNPTKSAYFASQIEKLKAS